ncbi:glycoside hydrolase family 10 protein [Nocardiopsis sp. CNT312]|uniref:glycoside hydrolase family 10 protein n=1 Tax=Nocardiopsis sp. CNT312 TaxID=1137268 RepID=UPI0004B9A4A5|nr:family 10 glycosylhydrolase [Nocardiopsis sp. CNT312]
MGRDTRSGASSAAAVVAAALLLAGCSAAENGGGGAEGEQDPVGLAACADAPDKRAMRGAWLTTVRNIDWPSETGLSADEQREELDGHLDAAAGLGLNAVFLQVRPTADAVYTSDLEPWARYLTGEQGGDPGYDPLEYAVRGAHERGLELHAWFNPYRIGFQDTDVSDLADGHPAVENPDWVVEYGDEAYFDPGDPEVRAWVTGVILDVVERYDVDGVHFDDYFYPYPKEGEDFDDDATWQAHGDGFDDRDDWRRENVNRLVADVHAGIEETEPWVSFGISPFGIWRNDDSDPEGSATAGLESYGAQHADTLAWIREGTVDYVTPQLYWYRGLGIADYEVLADWWSAQVAGTGVDLYIGQAAYKAGDEHWRGEDALSAQLDYSADLPGVVGDVYFSLGSLRGNAADAYGYLARTHYTRPVLPVATAPTGQEPLTGPVGGVAAASAGDGVEVSWEAAEGARFYAVYRLADAVGEDACAAVAPENLVGVTGGTALTDPAPAGAGAGYAVTALDDYRLEGPVGGVVAVDG